MIRYRPDGIALHPHIEEPLRETFELLPQSLPEKEIINIMESMDKNELDFGNSGVLGLDMSLMTPHKYYDIVTYNDKLDFNNLKECVRNFDRKAQRILLQRIIKLRTTRDALINFNRPTLIINAVTAKSIDKKSALETLKDLYKRVGFETLSWDMIVIIREKGSYTISSSEVKK